MLVPRDSASPKADSHRERNSRLCRLRSAAGQDCKHRSTFQGRLVLDQCDVGHTSGNRGNLRSSDLWMGGFTTAEAHFDLHFVAFFQETSRRPYANLQVMFVSARPQTDLLDLRDVLVLLASRLRLSCSNLNRPRSANPADRRVGGRRDLDQIAARLLCASDRLIDGNNADLLALFVDNADLGSAGSDDSCADRWVAVDVCQMVDEVWTASSQMVTSSSGLCFPSAVSAPTSSCCHLFLTYPTSFFRALSSDGTRLVPAPAAVTATRSIGAAALLFEARRAVDGLVAAGLEWHLGRLSAT